VFITNGSKIYKTINLNIKLMVRIFKHTPILSTKKGVRPFMSGEYDVVVVGSAFAGAVAAKTAAEKGLRVLPEES